MKFKVWYSVFLFFFAACGGQGEAPTNQSETSDQTTTTSPASLGKQKACEALSLATIATLMDVEEASINQEDMGFGEKRSICYYYTKEGNRKFFIRMAWKSEKAQKNEVLQKQYANYLSSGEEAIKQYDELPSSEQDQVLFGIGQDREQKYIHILRKRYGNAAEIQLELTQETKDATAKDRLMAVLETIN